jgi:dihydrofolate synthase/folylpolyglutamate synthase
MVENVATASVVLDLLGERGLTVPPEARRRGFARAFLPGRFQLLGSRPRILLDGAHNPQALKLLRESAESILRWKGLILILGVLRDKPVDEMLSELDRFADRTILTSPGTERALPVADLELKAKERGWDCTALEDPSDALSAALDMAGEDDLIVVAGSLFLVGRVMVCDPFRKQIYLDRSSGTRVL